MSSIFTPVDIVLGSIHFADVPPVIPTIFGSYKDIIDNAEATYRRAFNDKFGTEPTFTIIQKEYARSPEEAAKDSEVSRLVVESCAELGRRRIASAEEDGWTNDVILAREAAYRLRESVNRQV